jgi:cytochrome c-type biogenesis protein CcmE
MKQRKFIIGAAIIVGTLAWLGFRGASESKAYYHTIAELDGLHGAAAHHRIRVAGDIRPGSIQHLTGRIDFVIVEQGHALDVSYVGRDPLPDTFKDGSQALVEGHRMPNGSFVAEKVQAKCASKYEAVPGKPQPLAPGSSSPDSSPAAPSAQPQSTRRLSPAGS